MAIRKKTGYPRRSKSSSSSSTSSGYTGDPTDIGALVEWISSQVHSQNNAANNGSGKKTSINPYLSGTTSGNWTRAIGNGNSQFLDNLANQNQSGGDYKMFGFDDVLARFAGNSDISALLNALGINNGKGMSTSVAEDWNKQLLETFLNYQLTRENRSYNEALRDEQRIYDNPTNQLARMMGAGISRDAAIQMMSGAAGSSGGAGVPYSAAVAGSPGIAPSQSDLNDAQRKATIANTVFNGVQTLASLVGVGVDVAEAIPTCKMLTAQAFMSQEQVAAYKSVKKVTETAQGLIDTGAASYDEITNATQLEEFLNNNRDNPNVLPLFDSGAFTASFGTPIGRQMIADHWDNLMKTRTSGDAALQYIRGLNAVNSLTEANIDKVGVEMLNFFKDLEVKDSQKAWYYQQILNGQADVRLKNSQTKYTNAQADAYPELVQSQIDVNNANADLLDANTVWQSIQNDVQSVGLDELKQARLDELQLNALQWATINSSTARNNQMEAWLKNTDNLRLAATLKHMYLDSVIGFAQDHPDLYKWLHGLNDVGLFDNIESTAGSAGAVAQGAAAVGKMIKYVPK